MSAGNGQAKSKWMTIDRAAKLIGVSHTAMLRAVKAGAVESMAIEGGLVVRAGRPIFTAVSRESAVTWSKSSRTQQTTDVEFTPEVQAAIAALTAAIQQQVTSA